MSSPLTSAWSDNMHLDQLNAVARLNASAVVSTQGTDPQRFWATPSRMGDDESEECMEITLANEKLVNHISFDLAKFPHDCRLEFHDGITWRPLKHADRDEECLHTIVECNPPVLPPASAIEGHNHPQHSFSGHWEAAEFLCRPVRFQRMRLVLKRHTRTRHPRNSRGVRVAFSLAVRSFYCGYKVYSKDCVPAPQPVLASSTEHTEISTSTDVLGSQVSYSYRVNRAENILLNTDTPGRGNQTLVWRCEPQPFPQAVVNYFMDVRDGAGDPQVLDRFYIDPLYDGPNINLYYSNDEPEANFEAPDDPIPPQLAVINGQNTGVDPLGVPNANYGRITWVDMDATPISFHPHRKWWFGARLNWRFLRANTGPDHPIIDFGAFHLAWTAYGLRFATAHGDYFHVDCDDFHPATDFTFVSWHVDGEVRTRIKVNNQTFEAGMKLSVGLSAQTVSSIRLGGMFGASLSADFRLKHMVLKVDASVDAHLDAFLDDPTPYCEKPEFKVYDTGLTNNAVLRYSNAFPTQDFPTGLKGGSPTKYSDMEWAPIARNYTLRKGYLLFPPTKAKYWKFEFCSLVAEPYEVYVPIKRTVKTYRTEMWRQPVPAPGVATRKAVIVPGLSVSIDLGISFGFRTSIGLSVNASISGNTAKGYTATSVRIAASVHVGMALASISFAWGFQPAHPPTYVPRFETKCIHAYEEIAVETQTKIAFFVGLKQVKPYKVSYLATEDTAQYDEQFHDTVNLDPDCGWTLDQDHALSSGTSHYSQVQSLPHKSNRMVRGVQFASTQTAPVQLLPDDDFNSTDPSEHWREIGDGTMAPFTTETQRVGSTLRIDRSSRQPSWGQMSGNGLYPYWSSIESRGLTWADVELSGNPGQLQGGIECKESVATPPGGRVYAAARVIAPAGLSSRLYVQIIDDETGAVLAEEGADVKGNQVVEWYASHTIGGDARKNVWRWSDFSSRVNWPVFVDNFARANADVLGRMSSTGQTWDPAPPAHSLQGGEAVSVASGAYDYVLTHTPWGIFEMSVGTMGTGGSNYLFNLRPIRLDDQGFLSYSGGHSHLGGTSILGRAVQAGDDIRIDSMPTSLVPVNRRDPGYVDNVTAPYSLVFYLNGTWVKTVHHRLGARGLRSFMGKPGQHFRSFSWLPSSYGQAPGTTQYEFPTDVHGTLSANRLTYRTANGYNWAITGTIDISTSFTLSFTSAGRAVVDTEYWYGCLAAGIRTIAAGTMGPHGDVLVLDADANATVNALGNVMVGGVSQGNLFPGGIANGQFVQVQFLDTKSVASSVRGAINPAAFPKMLRALVNGTQVGVLAFAGMQSWTSTRRGLAGDVYDGAYTGASADYNTTFDSWNWAPDASNIAAKPATPTWDENSQRGTATYDSMSHYLSLHQGRMRARLIQRGSSTDAWDLDTLSMFVDPIEWSFSNDGGLNFYPATDIRNHPHGVLIFPQGVRIATDASQVQSAPGQSLMWRAVSYSPGQLISSLTIRPWYGGLLSGVTHRVGLATGGPNDMPFDHYPPIEQDARFQTWRRPIPSDWWYQNRVLKRTVDEALPPPSVLVLSEGLTTRYADGS